MASKLEKDAKAATRRIRQLARGIGRLRGVPQQGAGGEDPRKVLAELRRRGKA